MCARSDGEGVAVLPEEAQIGPEAQVADPGAVGGTLEEGVAGAGARPVVVNGDGQIHRQAEATAHHHVAAGVEHRLVAQEADPHVTVGAVEHHRAVGVVEDQAERRADPAAQVERLEAEPVAPSLGGIEGVRREAALDGRTRLRLRVGSRGGQRGDCPGDEGEKTRETSARHQVTRPRSRHRRALRFRSDRRCVRRRNSKPARPANPKNTGAPRPVPLPLASTEQPPPSAVPGR